MEKKYNIGLDIGTSSVGWAVTDEFARMVKFKGNNMWGVRLFDEAETAATRRGYRSTRRRLSRRGQRLDKLKEIFAEDIIRQDENFFIRQKESFLYTEDTSTLSASILFDDVNFTDKEYYEKYPTIYHLRKELMDVEDKKDIRLIYLALQHILKNRGHFLFGKGELGQGSENVETSIINVLTKIIDDEFDSIDIDIEKVVDILSSVDTKKNKQELLQKLIKHRDKDINNKFKELIKAILGYKFNLSKLFNTEANFTGGNKSFKDDFDETEVESILNEDIEIFEDIKNIYNWVTLEELLGDIDSNNPKDKTISNAMITKYNNHARQLKMLKTLVRDVCSDKDYKLIFRSKNTKNNYHNYINNTKNNSLEDLNKNIKKILDKYPSALEHKYYGEIAKSLDENNLLSKLNTTDNSAIPNQLHRVEMKRIIDNQGKYYPLLLKNKDLLLKILVSRLPYYVGPINRSSEFAWNIRIDDKEKSENIYPWNYEEFIDIDRTAEEFIKRMTNKCTYLWEEDVISRYSLLYSEFVLLNELNKVRVNGEFIGYDAKNEIIEDLFKSKKIVRVKDLEDWIRKNPSGFITNRSDEVSIVGTQDDNQFAASLESHYDFIKIFGDIDDSNKIMIEEIINWITIFEDKDILVRKIKDKYELDKKTIDKILKLNYSGWARLSKKLIDSIRTQNTKWTGSTIIEIMRKTNLNFMQIINDIDLNFKETIDKLNPSENKEKIDYEDVMNLHGSPSLKRGIWETVKIIEELVEIMGCEPDNIFIEFARGDEKSKRTTSRMNRMKKLYEEIKKDVDIFNKEVYDELQNRAKNNNKLDNRALYLYFVQNGRCMYTGEPLDPEHLYNYEIDHIIPRSYIKDDSIDNLALVTYKANQEKKDSLLLSPEIQMRQRYFWENLHKYGLISRKKLDNLNKTTIPDKELMGFINRQLVETRQISKQVSELLSEVYKDTKIISIKAKLSSDFRKQYSLYKIREVNDYHHAHDALIASVIGNFILRRYPFLENEVNIKKYIQWYKKENMHRDNRNKYGFILSSMNRDYRNDDFTWIKDGEISRVTKSLSYKDCFITKKVEEQTGAFFKASIYKKDSADAKIPLRKGLDPKKYGGRTGVKNAYFMIIKFKRKDKEIKKLVGIPMNLAKVDNQECIRNYLIDSENIEDARTLEIIKDKVKKYQLLEYKGHKMYLISQTELQNAVQLIMGKEYNELLDRIYNDKNIIAMGNNENFNYLISLFLDEFIGKLVSHYPMYESIVKRIRKDRLSFENLGFVDKIELIKQLLNLTAVNSKTGNFSKLGLSNLKATREGRILNQTKNGWSVDDMVFIDRSITGLYERRYKL